MSRKSSAVRPLMAALLAASLAASFPPFVSAEARKTPPSNDTITHQQADEIIQELRDIKALLQRVTTPQPAAPQAPQSVTLPPVTGYMLGSPTAPVTMVEFTDLQCPFCRQFHMTAFEEIKKAYIDTGKVRYISLDFPLNIHPLAMAAAEAEQCAGAQGQFWPMRHTIFLNNATLTPTSFETFATDLRLDLPKFNACVSADTYARQIAKDQQEGAAAGVSGTPSFVVGRTSARGLTGVRMVGAQPFAVFDAEIRSLLAGR
ncbi:MAG TPA: DsbA family protein [Vicinamibacterales bacterium]|jgi:protein-disulfide isomerase